MIIMRLMTMKKIKILMVSVLLCLCATPITYAIDQNQEPMTHENQDLTPQSESAYLMEYTSGSAIYAKEEHKRLYPASMTKMMGLLIIFEYINSQKLKWEDEVIASEYASSMGGSQVFLEPNEVMSVKDMVKSICIASANDAMVAMAEKIAGTHEGFVKMMNDKAKALQLQNTNFTNATGLHDANHYTSAYDIAQIAKALIDEGKQELLDITSTYDSYIRENSKQKFWLVNTNKLLKQYAGVDGLKTGFTQEAKSCITVTAKKNGLRLIAVNMKAPDSKIRNQEIKSMLDYGFSQYESSIYLEAGNIIESLQMENAKPSKVDLYLKEDMLYVHMKGKKGNEVERKIEFQKTQLPYVENEVIAKLKVKMDDGSYMESDLIVKEQVEPLNLFDIFLKTIKSFIA